MRHIIASIMSLVLPAPLGTACCTAKPGAEPAATANTPTPNAAPNTTLDPGADPVPDTLVFALPRGEPPVEPAPAADAPPIHQTYRGVFHAPRTLDPDTGRTAMAPTPPIVVTNDVEFATFIAAIPRVAMTKRQPAPPSSDPLLQNPQIDWTRNMLLVGFRSDFMAAEVWFLNLRRDGDDLRVQVAYPDSPDAAMMAQPLWVGAYAAIVVDRVPGRVLFD